MKGGKRKEWLRLLLILVVYVGLLVGPFWLAAAAILPPTREDMEECFQEDQGDLEIVANYLSSVDYGAIYIEQAELEEGRMRIGFRNQTIENPAVLEALDRLLGRCGYNRITKSNQTIVFEKWDYAGKDRGIACTIREEAKPKVEFLIHSEPLSESGWYYYEACYEEYRTRNEL